MIRVLIADPSQRITDNIVRRLAMEDLITVCGTASDGEHAVQEALRLQPDVALLDAQLPGMDGVQTTEMLAQYLPKAGVIMMSIDSENSAYRSAMLAGAREFLQKPFKGDDLVTAIQRVHDFQQRKRAVAPAESPVASEGEAPPARAPEAPPITGRAITVIAGKGGVGKSLVATNLAVMLAGTNPGKVVLVDLSLQFGDVAALLDIASQHTIADLAANDAVADREVVQQVLAEGPNGLKVLLAPARPELADYVTTTHLRALMDELRRSFDLVVIDGPAYLNEITLDSIENSDQVVLVTDFSVTAVKNTRLVLSVLEVLHVPAEHTIVVANHRDAAGVVELERGQVENFLKTDISVEVPFDPAVVGGSVSRGVPLVLSSPDSAVTKAVVELARAVGAPSEVAGAAGGPAPDKRPPKRPRRLLGFARG